MVASELRDLSAEELQQELERALKEQFNLRFQRATDQLPQTHLMTATRREIARIKTIIRERQDV
ncbi:MAG: 50S ribosomal protein L29 [Gammaproteobacteria bacterium]|nr:50S ribosomal protein L29 [Gammaproteobacteria bacterium]